MSEARAWRSFESDGWRPSSPAFPPHGSLGKATDSGLLPVLIVLAAVLFNAGLAIINAHVTPLSANVVIAAEVLIVVAAHTVIFANYRPQMLPWYAMIVIIVLFSLERSMIVGNFDPKFMRDVLLIPTFVLLGMTTPQRRTTTLIVILHLVVVSGVLLEAFFTQTFSSLFEVRQYYLATRPFDAANFWNASSDLFVSATRPGNRFLNFVDFHRISSVFLEPVSLGNYVTIITAFLCANYRFMSRKVLVFLILGNAIALVGCDGRLAAVSSALIVLAALASPWLPRKSALLYLPGALVCAAIIVVVDHPNPLEDNFLGRIAYTVDLLTRYDVLEWFGNSDRLIGPAADSGIAYTITTQSMVGLIAFWFFLVLNAEDRTLYQIRYLHGICIYITFTMLVSYSLFSIKTAALLWFIYGSLQMASQQKKASSVRATRVRRDPSVRPQFSHGPAW